MASLLLAEWGQHFINRGETLQVSWPGRVADTRLGVVFFLRPANHLGETEEEGGHQDLGGKGRGGNSRSSWTRQGYLVSVLCFRKGMACLNMATGISQAVLLIQPSPSGVFSIELHQ